MIGIIGGAGPEASAKLYLRIIEKCKEKGALYDWQFPHIFIDSVPFDDIISKTTSDYVGTQVKESILRLKNAGAKHIFANCNSLHAIIREGNHDVFDLPKEVSQRVRNNVFTRIVLLATSATIKHNIYEGFDLPTGKDQELLDDIILNIGIRDKRKKEFEYLVKKQNADCIILGCTDLSLFYNVIPKNVVDSLEVLADVIVSYSKVKYIF
ncbi:aspartate/glutamate racemase family protein [Candidatus Woesearchaeota archaeon]|nr:aspartate/glutamate racemase family protein [Candidatus Woesearchaeota archaeon]